MKMEIEGVMLEDSREWYEERWRREKEMIDDGGSYPGVMRTQCFFPLSLG
jgi:hypothetical protein